MPRVFRRAGDPEWWLDFVDETGERRRVKTTTTSKRAAEDLLAEKRADIKRIDLGLEVVPTSQFKTLGEAWRMWLREWCPEASRAREQRRFNANVEGSWLAEVRLAELSGSLLERWFNEKVKHQSATTVNGHRRIIRAVINSLIRKRLFRGVNPVKETQPLEQTEYAYEILTEAETRRVLNELDEHWRDLFFLAFSTGLRRGELFALRKDRTVVDLEKAMLTPRASNGRNKPKGKRVKSIPVTPEALEVLRRAWDKTEPGALLFPARDGVSMRPETHRTAEMLRSAMARAGLIEKWQHVCRTPKCPGKVDAKDEQQRKCEVCGNIMWPKPIVRHVRFHDLRHSAANHWLDHGVPLADVQLMLRHSSIVITEKTYRHRTVEALRNSVMQPSLERLDQQLDAMSAGQDAEVAAILAETRKKLALARHRGTNIHQLLPSKK